MKALALIFVLSIPSLYASEVVKYDTHALNLANIALKHCRGVMRIALKKDRTILKATKIGNRGADLYEIHTGIKHRYPRAPEVKAKVAINIIRKARRVVRASNGQPERSNPPIVRYKIETKCSLKEL